MKSVDNRSYKDAIYEQFSRLGRAVSSPRRLELLDLLSQGDKAVETLALQSGMSVANASQHLQALRAARLVKGSRKGVHVIYSLASPQVAKFFLAIKALAETQLADIEQITRGFLEGRVVTEAVDRATLRERVLSGSVIVLDVRPIDEYRAGHLPGAECVPLEELDRRLETLPHDQEIVAYCRGPYCLLAVEAVDRLRARGFTAFRLEDGVNEWRAMDLPVTTL